MPGQDFTNNGSERPVDGHDITRPTPAFIQNLTPSGYQAPHPTPASTPSYEPRSGNFNYINEDAETNQGPRPAPEATAPATTPHNLQLNLAARGINVSGCEAPASLHSATDANMTSMPVVPEQATLSESAATNPPQPIQLTLNNPPATLAPRGPGRTAPHPTPLNTPGLESKTFDLPVVNQVEDTAAALPMVVKVIKKEDEDTAMDES